MLCSMEFSFFRVLDLLMSFCGCWLWWTNESSLDGAYVQTACLGKVPPDPDITIDPNSPTRHRCSTLHSPLHSFPFSFSNGGPIDWMLEDAIKDASNRRNGAAWYVFHLPCHQLYPRGTDIFCVAKPATALIPFRAGQSAWISSSSSTNAGQVSQSPGLVSHGPPAPLSVKKERREVPLPSQEGKKGLAQYALCVESTIVAW
jgi:hypothetical protein